MMVTQMSDCIINWRTHTHYKIGINRKSEFNRFSWIQTVEDWSNYQEIKLIECRVPSKSQGILITCFSEKSFKLINLLVPSLGGN